jgi:glycosyltransferase involved in cell wall biosynthesis
MMVGIPHFVSMLSSLFCSEELVFIDGTFATNVPIMRRWLGLLLNILRSDVVYVLSGTLREGYFFKLARFLRKPIVMHWVGTDCLLAAQDIQKGLASVSLIQYSLHWVEVPWIADELDAIGISAHVVPLTSTMFPQRTLPLPEIFTVLAYLPESRNEFYGRDLIFLLAQEFPEVKLLIVGSTEDSSWVGGNDVPLNISFLGHPDDIGVIYEMSTVLVRITEHDGLSFMVLEAMAHGRYVIWSHALGPVLVSKNFTQLSTEIKKLLILHHAGQLNVNHEGMEWVRKEYNPQLIANNFREKMLQVIRKR